MELSAGREEKVLEFLLSNVAVTSQVTLLYQILGLLFVIFHTGGFCQVFKKGVGFLGLHVSFAAVLVAFLGLTCTWSKFACTALWRWVLMHRCGLFCSSCYPLECQKEEFELCHH